MCHISHVESRSKEVILALCSVLIKSHLECWVQFWPSQLQKGHGKTVQSPVKATKMSKGDWSIPSMRKGTNTLNCNAEFLLPLMLSYLVMLSDDIWAWCLTKSLHSSESCVRILDCAGNYFWDSRSMRDCCAERDNTGYNLSGRVWKYTWAIPEGLSNQVFQWNMHLSLCQTYISINTELT